MNLFARSSASFARKKLPPKAAYAQYALACAVCELLFMNTPDYAVINSCVNLVKKNCDRYVAGFVNAVLRKIAAEKELLKQHDKGEFFTPAFFELLNVTIRPVPSAKFRK